VRITFRDNQKFLAQLIEIKDSSNYIPILSNFEERSVLNFYRDKTITLKNLKFQSRKVNKIIFNSKQKQNTLNLDVRLEENYLHFRYCFIAHKSVKYSKIIINYAILLGNDPDYTWVPHIRPKKNDVIADHIFRSPVIIYKKGVYSFAFIPDLSLYDEEHHYKSFMDFNLKSEEFQEKPLIAYGFGNYKPTYHVFFKHSPKKTFKLKRNTKISLGYYLKLYKSSTISEILKDVNRFLWETYGRGLLYKSLNPQVLPYDICVKEGFKALIERHNYWGEFKINNVNCGGIFLHSFLGKNKKSIIYITEETFKEFKSERSATPEFLNSFIGKIFKKLAHNKRAIKFFDKMLPKSKFSNRYAEIRNNAWFLNIRTGYGLRFFGKLWNDYELMDKGKKILNTVLNLPRIRGVFPGVILPIKPNANKILTVNGLKAHIYTDDFNIVDVCLTMFWALKYFQDFGDNGKIIEICEDLLDLIEEIQLDNGAIPTYISFKKNKKIPEISEDLINSASSGAPLMFLMEYNKIKENKRIIYIAEKIAEFLQKEIIPQDKWHDFEPFYSCTNLPKDIYDSYTKSHVRNNLCIYWCADGLRELYKATKNEKYFRMGERVLAVLSLYQQVWDMPYISFNTYGGFGVQNADAELSDARQSLFVRVYMDYYLITGYKEYMERAIAALRASFALMILREYEQQCPGNLKGIKTVDGIDRGSMFENYGHVGYDMHCSPFMLTDWGVGSSATAIAYVKNHYGDVFIDFQEKLVWGIDSISIKSFIFKENKLKINIETLPKKKHILIKCRLPPSRDFEIIINDITLGKKSTKELSNGINYKLN